METDLYRHNTSEAEQAGASTTGKWKKKTETVLYFSYKIFVCSQPANILNIKMLLLPVAYTRCLEGISMVVVPRVMEGSVNIPVKQC